MVGGWLSSGEGGAGAGFVGVGCLVVDDERREQEAQELSVFADGGGSFVLPAVLDLGVDGFGAAALRDVAPVVVVFGDEPQD